MPQDWFKLAHPNSGKPSQTLIQRGQANDQSPKKGIAAHRQNLSQVSLLASDSQTIQLDHKLPQPTSIEVNPVLLKPDLKQPIQPIMQQTIVESKPTILQGPKQATTTLQEPKQTIQPSEQKKQITIESKPLIQEPKIIQSTEQKKQQSTIASKPEQKKQNTSEAKPTILRQEPIQIMRLPEQQTQITIDLTLTKGEPKHTIHPSEQKKVIATESKSTSSRQDPKQTFETTTQQNPKITSQPKRQTILSRIAQLDLPLEKSNHNINKHLVPNSKPIPNHSIKSGTTTNSNRSQLTQRVPDKAIKVSPVKMQGVVKVAQTVSYSSQSHTPRFTSNAPLKRELSAAPIKLQGVVIGRAQSTPIGQQTISSAHNIHNVDIKTLTSGNHQNNYTNANSTNTGACFKCSSSLRGGSFVVKGKMLCHGCYRLLQEEVAKRKQNN